MHHVTEADRPLRVALVHSFYRSEMPSGENAVVEAEVAALDRAGVEVELFAARTDELRRDRLYPLRSALRVATGRGAHPLAGIERFGPDVVHVHNLFPNLGRRWVDDVRVPLVHTMHNFRPVCINTLLLRDGAVCTLCPDGDRWAGVRHGCYQGSRVASVPPTWANRRGPAADPLLRRADRILVLSQAQADVLVGGGVPADRLVHDVNFLPRSSDPGADRPGTGPWLFVGRLRDEKGITRLLEHWPRDEAIRIVGQGPQEAEVRRLAAGLDAHLVGPLTRAEVLTEMRAAQGLVFPSICLEAAPLVYLEALAAGLPVIAFYPSGPAEAIARDGTGVVAPWDRAGITAALQQVRARRSELFERCRAVFEAQHTEDAFVQRRGALYRWLVASTTAGEDIRARWGNS